MSVLLKTVRALNSRQFTKILRQLSELSSSCCCHQQNRGFHTTLVQTTFWERDKKGGYNRHLKLPSKKQMILDGFKELKGEIRMWREEMKETLASDPILVFRPGK